ncbi:hypothetical protein M426DRAFT_28293 [Hypoxylon sp. CI-4A]|nr:hypothetical protein M426DRAFT_28293 [Hypoxylon sp. CI-4A]
MAVTFTSFGEVTGAGGRVCHQRAHSVSHASYDNALVEVDENGIIRAFYRDVQAQVLPQPEYQHGTLPSASSHPALKWRAHSEVAMEIGKHKKVMAIYDLVDPTNMHLVVVGRDRIFAQGDKVQTIKILQKAKDLFGLGIGETIEVMLVMVSGPGALADRRQDRQGGLVDFYYKSVSMDKANEEALLSKSFPGTDFDPIILVEFLLPDTSPMGSLKPGRRLLRLQDMKF